MYMGYRQVAMMITCERCGTEFERAKRRGPIPKYCSDACKAAKHRQRTSPATATAEAPPRQGLTLRDVINVAQLDLSVKQCDVILEAFTKARLRAARREREAVS
jgi:hypothetical protein